MGVILTKRKNALHSHPSPTSHLPPHFTWDSPPEGYHLVRVKWGASALWSGLTGHQRVGTLGLKHRKLEVCVKCWWLKGFGFIKIVKPFSLSILILGRTDMRRGTVGTVNDIPMIPWLVNGWVGTSHRSSDSKSKALSRTSAWLMVLGFSYFDIHHYKKCQKNGINPFTLKWFLFEWNL